MNPPPSPFRLPLADRNTSTWIAIRAHLSARIDALRVTNDTDQDEVKTARLRGRIAELKSLLDLDQDLPRQED